ncbi:MAG: MmcQ/YjbR family DNA-binding protein [Bryobacterales bacterium]|jgi:predicted DNA-binding protein (MmcQ/YjbR family)|nr:MmcQ/YjbR family DNA-binding protein [Bryobacterales bacterium]
MDEALLVRVRALAVALAETDETMPFGDPWFRVRAKMFCCFTSHEETPALVVKVGKENLDLFLRDARFFKSPYIGNAGWVGLRLVEPVDWEEVRALVHSSYNRVAPKALRLPEES